MLNEAWRRSATRALQSGEQERAARAAAEDNSRQLGLALEAGRMGTWEHRLDDGTVLWSPGLESIHGYAPGSFPGTLEAFRDQIHPDDRNRVLAAIGNAVEQRQEHRIEYRIVRPDGPVRWVEERGQLFSDANGRPQRMLGVCIDVTERKEQEERAHLAMEASPAAMVIFAPDGAVVYANTLAHQLFGYSGEELVGLAAEALVPPRWRGRHADYRGAFLGAPQRRPMGAGRELFALRKDGTEVPVEIGLSPFTSGDRTFVLAAITDISQRRQVEAERTALLERERDLSRRKDEFLAVLSHELRNPLAPLRNAVHILATEGADAAMAAAARGVLERQLRHLVRLVDDLLDASRVGQPQFELQTERLPLVAVLEAALEASQPLFETRRQRLTVALPPGPLWVEADLVRLAQVFTNILNNAARYTPEGGNIELTAQLRQGDAVVSVRDNGAGMSRETLGRLFELFYRDESAGGAVSGLGIGLALARRLVELHGGTITAHSDGPGHGSELVLTLPTAAAPAAGPPTPEASAAVLPRRILVADDNVDAAESLAGLLRRPVTRCERSSMASRPARRRPHSSPRWRCSPSGCRVSTATRWRTACVSSWEMDSC